MAKFRWWKDEMKAQEIVMEYNNLKHKGDMAYNIYHHKSTMENFKAMENACIEFNDFRNKRFKGLKNAKTTKT